MGKISGSHSPYLMEIHPVDRDSPGLLDFPSVLLAACVFEMCGATRVVGGAGFGPAGLPGDGRDGTAFNHGFKGRTDPVLRCCELGE